MPTRSLTLALFAPFALFAAPPASPELAFEPNRGQTAPSVRYVARASAGAVYFTDREVVLRQPANGSAVRFELLGARPEARWEEAERGAAATSYILGRDPAGWIRNIPQYRRLLRRGVYPGIDAAWYGNGGRLEYDFLLAPHADPGGIRIRIGGASRVTVTEAGGLEIETPAGVLRQRPPDVYQILPDGRRASVEGRFQLAAPGVVAFGLGDYDRSLPLCIDPVLESSAYIGGSDADSLIAAVSPTRYAGSTSSLDFPAAPFGRRRGKDIVVHTGSSVIVIGGSGNEEVTAASVTPSGDIAVVGYTDSKDLPSNFNVVRNVQVSAWQPEFSGGASDGFFLWIAAPSGSTANGLYLSYVGTAGDDRITAITSGYGFTGYTLVGNTDGRDLPTGQGAYRPFQSAPSGGVDGFAMVVGGFSQSTASIYFSTYFGGSGDDRPSAVLNTTAGLMIAGETSSSDFPLLNPLSSARSGPTDAFLLRLQARSGEIIVAGGTLLGGNGADRATLLALQNGNLAMAGATSSTDLPVSAGAVQTSYGGGDSDIFIARYLLDLSQLLGLTYYGGSGAEEPTAAGQEQAGTLYLTGWTSSADFPVREASQPTYGGGPDDAFLLHFTAEDTLYHATFFGGSGSDRMFGLYLPGDLTVYLAGRTTSRDLPAGATSPGLLSGSSDGFLTRISAPLLWAFRGVGAKGFRGSTSVSVGLLNGSRNATITVTSSNPSSVLLAPSLNAPGQSSLELPANPESFNPAFRSYYIDCQVEVGGVDLIVSAEGYPSRTVRADCYPAQARVSSIPFSMTSEGPNRLSTVLWNPESRLSLSLVAVNPERPADATSIAATVSPLVIQVLNSDPRTLSSEATAAATPTSSLTSFAVKPLRVGEVTLSFSMPGTSLSGSIVIAVKSPVGLVESTIPAGFQTTIGTYSGAAPPNTVGTLTSGDPARLLFSTDANQRGSASVEFRLDRSVYVQGLAPGDVTIQLAVPGFDPVTSTVHVAQPTLHCTGCARSATLGIGDTLSFSVWIGAPQDTTSPRAIQPLAGSPVRISLQMSSAGVVSAEPSFVDWKDSGFYAATFRITAAAPGSTALTWAVNPAVAFGPSAGPMELQARRFPFRISDIDVGKDLAATGTITFAGRDSAAVTLTVADPSMALLSADNRAAGQRQVTIPRGFGRFSVQGLAASGRTTITAESPGYDTVTVTVTLNPSGFAWGASSLTSVQYNSPFGASLYAVALDSTTGMPIAAETLRFGVTATPQVRNSDAGVVTFSAPAQMNANDSAFNLSVTPKGPGDATLAIVQPAAFFTPAIRQELPIHVDRPVLRLFGATFGKDTLNSLSIGLPTGAPGEVTIASSDPGRLLLAANRTDPGAASITLPNGGSFTQFYAYGMDSSGTATLTATMPGFVDGSATYRLAPVGVGLSTDISPSGGPITITTQSANWPLRLAVYVLDSASGQSLSSTFSGLRPGAEPPVVTVVSSNPEVGRIEGSPFRISFDSSERPALTFRPIAPGEAEVSVIQPPGYAPPANLTRIPFRVTAPGFQGSPFTMARDTVLAQRVSLGGGVQPPSANVEVTISSADPTRVVLSSTPTSPTAASVTKTIVAGRYVSDDFYVHALDNSGTVPLTISAAGYDRGTMNVTLSDLTFYFTESSSSTQRAIIQSGSRQYGIGFRAVGGFSDSGNAPIRPGAAPIILNVSTSDAATLAVDTPRIVFEPGATRASVTVTPIAPGPAVLALEVPAPYVLSQTNAFLPVTVEGARLSLNSYSTATIGKDLQVNWQAGAEVTMKAGTAITLTSSDPSRLLLSPDRNMPGQLSILIRTENFSTPNFWLQGLADNGTVAVTASADGYQSASLSVTLVPSAAIFSSGSGATTIYNNAGSPTVTAYLSALDPVTLRPSNAMLPRPGANLTCTVVSSNPSVLAPSVSSLTFAGVETEQRFTVRPAGLGTAVLSLGPLPGGATPSAGGQVVYTVTEPDLFVPNITVAYGFQAPIQVRLASRLPAPSTDLLLSVVAVNFAPSVGDGRNPPLYYPNTLTVRIPAGQRVSAPFYVQGRQIGIGSFQVTAPSTGYNSAESIVTVVNPAFVIKESTPVTMTVGGTASLTVVPALTPLGTEAPQGMAFGVGLSRTVIPLSIATPSMVTATPGSVSFNAGDQQATVTLRGLASGSTTISLGALPGYQIPNARSSVEVRVAR